MQSNNLENTIQNIKDSKIRNNLVDNEIKQTRNTILFVTVVDNKDTFINYVLIPLKNLLN